MHDYWAGRLEVPLIDPEIATFHMMKSQRAINSPPEVEVFDRHQFAKRLPLPVVGSPLLEPLLDPTRNVFAGRDQSYVRRLIEGFEPSHSRQQLEPLALHVRFFVGRFELGGSVGGLQDKTPVSSLAIAASLGIEQKVGSAGCHRQVAYGCLGEENIAADGWQA